MPGQVIAGTRTRWSDYGLRWMVFGTSYVAGAAWLLARNVPFDFPSALPHLVLQILLLAPAALCVRLGRAWPRFRRPLAVTEDLLLSMSQLLALEAVAALLIHLAAYAGSGVPLQDGLMAGFDAVVGFDWHAMSEWVDARPAIARVLAAVYWSEVPQGVLLLLLGSMRRPGQRNAEVIWLMAVSLGLTTAVFAFVPVAGLLGHLDWSTIGRLLEIRAGGARVSYSENAAIVSFPSFHTAAALVFVYMSRHRRWSLAVFAVVNAVMLVAIPPIGGHYLADMCAGAGVALASIVLVRAMTRCLPYPSEASPA